MQAGESLSFISIPEELAVPEPQSEQEKEIIWRSFGSLIQTLMVQYPDSFRSVERTEEIGPITIKEGSFQVSFADGSYLHIVAYGHRDDIGYLDLGLSIAEHSDEGYNLGGYLYEMTGDSVLFTRHRDIEDTTEDREDEVRFHFSVIDLYEGTDEMYALQFSDDEDQRAAAQEATRQHEEAAELTLVEQELGFGWATPTGEDIDKLEALMTFVVPFTVPQA